MLTAFHFLFVLLGGSRKCADETICFTHQVYHGIFSVAETGSQKFSAYEESLQIQLRKTLAPGIKKLWTSKDWRNKVDSFALVFSDLMKAEILHSGDKALLIAAGGGQGVLALKEIGVDSLGVDLVPSLPLVLQGNLHRLPFPPDTFDFVFSNPLQSSAFSEDVFSEMERTLKPGGFAVIQISKQRLAEASVNDENLPSIERYTDLFKNSDVFYVKNVGAYGMYYEIALKKRRPVEICSKRKLNPDVINAAEPLILEEPRKPWIVLKENAKKIRYLTTVSDISGRNHYYYIDVGARSYSSSIGSWFKKRYPKQEQDFHVYAVEADDSFAEDYIGRRNVQLMPFAAWIRNESLVFGANPENRAAEGEIGMGRIQSNSSLQKPDENFKIVQGIDFSHWLMNTVTEEDFVVMKMDIEGTEFDLLPKMIETGAICLVDELFLECHYNRWQKSSPLRTSKYQKTYGECLALFQALRSKGVLVHQWW
jgi:SAM-dependent methyltransferase